MSAGAPRVPRAAPPASMRAILYRPDAGARLAEVPVPEVRDGEALLAVEACGLCGTDLMKLAKRPPQAVLGHELCGRLVRLGAGVEGFREGDRVVSAHHVPCLECHYCRRGSEPMCRQFKATNVSPGGFSEYVLLSAAHLRRAVLKVPDGLGPVEASQTEPLACCLRNAKRLRLDAGDTAGIVGLGAIGLLTAQLLARRGVKTLGLDLDALRARGLAPWGTGFTAAEDFEREALARTDGRGLDALLFTAGTAEMVGRRLSWIRDGGALNIFASFEPSTASLDLNEVYHRELTVTSSYSPSLEDLRESLGLIASGAVSVASLGAKAFPLERFAEAAAAVRRREVLKAVLIPGAS